MPKNTKNDLSQILLFGSADQYHLQTRVIAQQADFDNLFIGYNKMKAISYVASPDLLLGFFDKRGYAEIEIVVGDNLSADYKKSLEQKSIEVTERLEELLEKGVLTVFVPNRTIHTKMYLLEKSDGSVRVIQTSANLTETAQRAKRQINYAWYLDLPAGETALTRLLQDYESHREICTPFMEDLKNLISQHPDRDKKQLIEAWLKGTISEEQDTETRRIFQELSASLIQGSESVEEPVAILRLPDSAEAKKRVDKILNPLKPVVSSENHIHVNSSAYIKYVYETRRVPLLMLDRHRHELLLGLDIPMLKLTESLPEVKTVNHSLELLESYINTVDLGQSTDHLAVKTGMFEALLYVFFSPFANEYIRMRRARYGLIDTRGPRFLYIYGPSQNGKSTFLHFSLKLLTGRAIEPLSREDFTKTRILGAATTGTVFPLIFDDVDPSYSGLEDIFKSYWERWWKEQYVTPQIIITSNTPRLQEWAKSRVIRIDFDVHFAGTAENRVEIANLFKEDNPIFKWFSFLYLDELDKNKLPGDDELYLARMVMKRLYEYVGRPLPSFFPTEPIEKLYDPGRRDWRDILFELHKVDISHDGNRSIITFPKDMQFWEVTHYQSSLPQTVKSKRKGSTLIIENPREFQKWLGQPQSQNWFARLFKRK